MNAPLDGTHVAYDDIEASHQEVKSRFLFTNSIVIGVLKQDCEV